MRLGSVIALLLPVQLFAGNANNLLALAHVESGNGRNMNHPRVWSGNHAGERAGGRWGILPSTAKFILTLSPRLMLKYGYIKGLAPDQISESLTHDGEMDHAFASTLWGWLRDRFSKERAAYSWLHGWGAGAKASGAQVRQSSYVKKFLLELSRLEQ